MYKDQGTMPEAGGRLGPGASASMSDSENEYDDTEQFTKDEDEKMGEQSATSEGAETNGEVKKKYDPKDPLRPRRKKARRACFACQRAHLTCGKFILPSQMLPFAVASAHCAVQSQSPVSRVTSELKGQRCDLLTDLLSQEMNGHANGVSSAA